MKTIQEAGPTEIAAIKRRTIRTLAMGKIDDQQCAFINKHLDAVSGLLESMKKEEA
jgi:hypothetical protein